MFENVICLQHFTESLKGDDFEIFCFYMTDEHYYTEVYLPSTSHNSDIEFCNINIETSLAVHKIFQL